MHATFEDGVTTTLPIGGLDRGRCSCGAPGVCRHIVGLVLAYQRAPAPFGRLAEADRRGAVEEQPAGLEHSGDARPGSTAGQPAGAVENPQSGAVETPGSGAVETPGSGAVETPGSGAVETPGSGAVETPRSGAVEQRRSGSVDGARPGEAHPHPTQRGPHLPPHRPPDSHHRDPAGPAEDPAALAQGPGVLADRPAVLAELPATLADGPATLVDGPATLADRPAVPESVILHAASGTADALAEGSGVLAEVPAVLADDPATLADDPATLADLPATLADLPAALTEGSPVLAEGPAAVTEAAPASVEGSPSSAASQPPPSEGSADAIATEPPDWSPGEFTEAQLAARIGERMLAAARRAERIGFVARVHRARPGHPVPSVELPTATVRFLVPRDLGFARTDAVAGVRDDVLALAVWAFREADAHFPGLNDVQVQVGGDGAAPGGPGLDAAVALAGLVLREGAVHVGAGLSADVVMVRRALEAGRMRWPLLAVDDLVAQLAAYRDRSARYRPDALADHVAEIFARRRAVSSTGAEAGDGRTGVRALRSRVLGTEEASETPLRRARLDGLGARVSAVGGDRVVEVFLAHADSATVLVLRRSYETTDAGPRLAGRKVAGVSLAALAGGAVVTESAARSASRAVRLGTRRLSRTEAMTSRGSWEDLPRALIADDLGALAAELDGLPPRPVRARVEAELVRVVPVAEVRSISYAPGAQRLDAVITDAAGVTAVVSATHAACAPGRLDSMAAALRGDLRYVAGSVRRSGGEVVIDPTGFALADSVVVPDLTDADRTADPGSAPAQAPDALGLALDEAAAVLAELAHGGLQHAPATVPDRLRATARRLRGVGLRRAGEAVEALAAGLGPDPGDAAVEAWVDAHLRVNLAAEMR
uniref:hypothetical protein n=1 Tax=Actinoplanes nipponensis TaxID=135950 RepID=UPI00366DE28D